MICLFRRLFELGVPSDGLSLLSGMGVDLTALGVTIQSTSIHIWNPSHQTEMIRAQ